MRGATLSAACLFAPSPASAAALPATRRQQAAGEDRTASMLGVEPTFLKARLTPRLAT